MGIINPRAICPNCGSKIHTQGGLFAFRHSTGTKCPNCGVALTGRTDFFNNAQLSTRRLASDTVRCSGCSSMNGPDAKFCRHCGALLASEASARPAEPAAARSVADQVRELADLREEGLVSPEEFETKRKQLLGL